MQYCAYHLTLSWCSLGQDPAYGLCTADIDALPGRKTLTACYDSARSLIMRVTGCKLNASLEVALEDSPCIGLMSDSVVCAERS